MVVLSKNLDQFILLTILGFYPNEALLAASCSRAATEFMRAIKLSERITFHTAWKNVRTGLEIEATQTFTGSFFFLNAILLRYSELVPIQGRQF